MERTQIYLDPCEKKQLALLAKTTGKSQSALIRQAIDEFLNLHPASELNKINMLREAKGLWETRDDLPNFEKLRRELDR